MTAETDIAAIDDGGKNTAAEVRTALTSVLARGTTLESLVDETPASPNAMDDEFDDDSLDTGLWTELNNSGPVVSFTEAKSGLVFSSNENADQLRGLYQAVPSGDWRVQAKAYRSLPAVSTYEVTLFAAASTTGTVYEIALWHESAATNIRTLTRTAPTAAASSVGSNWGDAGSMQYAYLEIEWDNTAGDLFLRASATGVDGSFVTAHSVTSGFTPAIVGVGITNRNSAQRFGVVDWFRRVG